MRDKEPLVSVAMATFNGDEYIEKQILSILGQTYNNLELVISDDGSTDSTFNIIEKYSLKYSNITIIRNTANNKGFVGNFQNALSRCAGEYIVLSDQDDIWFKDKIEKLVHNIHCSDLIYSDATLIDKNDNIIADSYSDVAFKKVNPESLTDLILNNPVTGCTVMVTKALLSRSLPFPRNIPAHDQWLAIKAWLGSGITYYNKPLIGYRQHERNQIGAAQVKNENITYKIKNVLGKRKTALFLQQENKMLSLVMAIQQDVDSETNLNKSDKNKLNQIFKYYNNIVSGNNFISVLVTRIALMNYFTPKLTLCRKIVGILSVFKIIMR